MGGYIYIHILVSHHLSIFSSYCFWIKSYLPRERGNREKVALVGRSQGVKINIEKVMEPRQLTALVVDDDMMVRMIHRKILDSVGVKNQVVQNGKEAVDIHRSGQNFDLILMDMDMPIMNGIETTKELRSMGIHSTIAGVSARSVESHIREFVEAGLDCYLEKPLNVAKLASIIHKIFHKL